MTTAPGYVSTYDRNLLAGHHPDATEAEIEYARERLAEADTHATRMATDAVYAAAYRKAVASLAGRPASPRPGHETGPQPSPPGKDHGKPDSRAVNLII